MHASKKQWLAAMGVSDFSANAPINRMQEPEITTPETAKDATITMARKSLLSEQTAPNPERAQSPIATLAALESAKTIAKNAATLDDLRRAVQAFDGLAIKKTATKTVFADGNPKAKVMLIGEAPGANEDVEGIPFCGQSGKLLDQMLGFIGLKRAENFYITNTVFWRPPGNRRPTPEELAVCRPFVEKHIALIAPDVLVLVGGTAVESLLKIEESVSKLRQKTHSYHNEYLAKPVPAVVIFHPSYLLRQPSQKKLAWQDLLKLKNIIKPVMT